MNYVNIESEGKVVTKSHESDSNSTPSFYRALVVGLVAREDPRGRSGFFEE
jgi:hypothetical protein